MASENVIDFTVINWVTVIIMVVGAFAVFGVGVLIWNKYIKKGSSGSNNSTASATATGA